MKEIVKALSMFINSENGTLSSMVNSLKSNLRKINIRKERPTLTYDSTEKIIRFINAVGSYKVNNERGNVIKAGEVSLTNYAISLRNLSQGKYLIKLEQQEIVVTKSIDIN